jgi:hypothetical protein
MLASYRRYLAEHLAERDMDAFDRLERECDEAEAAMEKLRPEPSLSLSITVRPNLTLSNTITRIILRPRLCFRSDLPDCVALCIFGQLRHRGGGLAAMVCQEFSTYVASARELNMFKSEVRPCRSDPAPSPHSKHLMFLKITNAR